MKLSIAECLFNKHNNGEIYITKIISDNGILLDNISRYSKLKYNEDNKILTYIDENGIVNNIVRVYFIDQIIYTELSSSDNNNNFGNCNCDSSNCSCDENCSCRNNYENDLNANFPEIAIVSKGYNKNGIIYPTELEDGSLIYDCAMGKIKEYICGRTSGSIKTNNNIFSKFFGLGYVLLNYGLLNMNIYVPETGLYTIKIRAGSENSSGKRGSIFLDNVEYFVRTSADKKGIWQIVYPQKYCENEDYFLEVDSIKLLSGTNKVTLRIDQNRGTINNAYDCIILKRDNSKPNTPSDCSEYFHISENQYAKIIKNIENLNDTTSSLREELKHTFITLNSIDDLLNLSENELTNGRMFKVNDIGNGNFGFYIYDEKSGFIKYDFGDPKSFITLDTYSDLVNYTKNNENLVHGKLVRVNRPSSSDLDDLTIENPIDYRKPAYYYYDSIGKKWLAVDFGGTTSSSGLSKNEVEEIVNNAIDKHNKDLNSHAEIKKELNRTLICVNNIEERDKLDLVDGRVVRVANDGSGESKYFVWNSLTNEWEEETFGQLSDNISINQVSGLEDKLNVMEDSIEWEELILN